MLSISEIRHFLAVLVPVYFEPEVESERVRSILERTFTDHELFCEKENLLVVVDSDSTADQVLSQAGRSSSLFRLNKLQLETNRGKTGAVREGLSSLLQISSAAYLVTRDCDGDHLQEDLPRLVSAACHARQAVSGGISVFGARPSLSKPMNWIREQWELLTNAVTVDLVELMLARNSNVLDRRFWNGYPLDLQSGYRLYDRWAASAAVDSLSQLPDDREVYWMACEMLPFLDISLRGGTVAQVLRGTQVEQPVSSYSRVPFSRCYGKLLAFMADSGGVERSTLRQVIDNHLVSSPAFFSQFRDELLECRNCIDPASGPVLLPDFL